MEGRGGGGGGDAGLSGREHPLPDAPHKGVQQSAGGCAELCGTHA